MSFVIQLKDGTTREWHIQSKLPLVKSESIELLQADGHELEYIRDTFHSLPIKNGMCIWRDTYAQFIFDNL